MVRLRFYFPPWQIVHVKVNDLILKGDSGLGKSTLVNSLFMTDLYAERVLDNVTGKQTYQFKLNCTAIKTLFIDKKFNIN